MCNVGERSVQRARVVLTEGTPELIAAVDSGTMAVSAAAGNPRELPNAATPTGIHIGGADLSA